MLTAPAPPQKHYNNLFRTHNPEYHKAWSFFGSSGSGLLKDPAESESFDKELMLPEVL
jgi:hypothetical protein